MSAKVGPEDAQRIVLRGINLDHACYFILAVVDPDDARRFVGRLVADIEQQSATTPVQLAIGFTFDGLNELRLASIYMDALKLSPAFCAGAVDRAASVGDIGPCEPQQWDQPFLVGSHVLLSLHADDPGAIDDRVRKLTEDGSPPGGMMGWDRPIRGKHIGGKKHRKEPFGFRDGISQPTLEGVNTGKADAIRAGLHVMPGELLLGYPNEDNEDPWAEHEIGASASRFFKNGSFAAFRKMQQDVALFREATKDDFTRAKLCGRWQNGAVVEPNATKAPPIPSTADLNHFDFAADGKGHGCPFGSHIRRLNPRGDNVVPPRKRVLMRRGIPYQIDGPEKTTIEEGLLGLFFCADLVGQFEFLLGQWGKVPPLKEKNENAAADPLMGFQEDNKAVFKIPGATPDQIEGLQSFVTTRGTMYTFYPSKTALKVIGGTS